MNNQKLEKLKPLYESELKVAPKYTPFFVRMTEAYDGKNGVLFVGKAENMKGKDGMNIDSAFEEAQTKPINREKIVKTPVGRANRSAYNRVVAMLARFLHQEKGINSFARTNLYKLSTTTTHAFGSSYETAFTDIFKKEIELLQPKYVIMLTSGKESPFMECLGKEEDTPQSVEFESKKIKCIKFEGIDSIFITALHPQGKPEKELVEKIKGLINNTGNS